MYKKILGFIRMIFHLSSLKNREKLNKIVGDLVNIRTALRKKVFVMTVGFSHSGKSTLVKTNPMLRKFFRLQSDKIHDVLNENYEFLQDDNKVTGKSYWERQFFTHLVRKKILEKLFSNGFAVVNDSCNLSRKDRAQRLRLAKKYGYKTMIIWVVCPENVLLERLYKADDDSVASGGNKVWLDLYKMQKEIFEPPEIYEANKVFYCDSLEN